jgi:hypothetical protein
MCFTAKPFLTFSQKRSNLVEIYENLNSNEKNAYLMVIPSGGAWLFIKPVTVSKKKRARKSIKQHI